MQPKTAVTFDPETFNRVKKTIAAMSTAKHRRRSDPSYASPIPEEIDIQLTQRCNIRCRHCYQWNEDGLFTNDGSISRTELDVSAVEKLLAQSREKKSRLYVWGGEPLVHREWDDFAKVLETDPRWTSMCTNGLLIEKQMESLLRISSNLALLVSLDGFQEEHDAIRGQGTYERTIRNLASLLNEQKAGRYKGKISIACMLSDRMVGKLYDFMATMEEAGVDTVYFAFPWYISDEMAHDMDIYYESKFSWMQARQAQQKPSWYSYSYHLSPEYIEPLKQEIERLISRVWKIRIRLHPALELHEIENFILGKDQKALNRKQCLAVSNRMEVLADGSVCACKFFPEFTIGSIYDQDLSTLWHCVDLGKIREIINDGLMPICSRCVTLYINGQ